MQVDQVLIIRGPGARLLAVGSLRNDDLSPGLASEAWFRKLVGSTYMGLEAGDTDIQHCGAPSKLFGWRRRLGFNRSLVAALSQNNRGCFDFEVAPISGEQ